MNTILITVILVTLLAFSIWLISKDEYWDNEVALIGIILLVTSIFLLGLHIISLSLMSYSYEQFEVKRGAFETTLNNAREVGNKLEAATILRDVAEWNTELASRKYDNTTYVFGMYTDDRIDTLNPIK